MSYAVAQESVSPLLEGMESEKTRGVEYTNFNEGESSNSQRLPAASTQAQRDTLRTRSNPIKPKVNPAKLDETAPKSEDSVLGFNFLYYIFQKYKMSDIID